MLPDASIRCGYRLAWLLLRGWWRIRGGQGRGAAVAVWSGARLLVVQPSYRAGLCLPGGGLRWREPPLPGALRELREETGLRLRAEDLRAGPRLRFAEGRRRVTEWVFEARLGHRPHLVPDRREIRAIHWLTPAALERRRLAPGLAAYLAWLRGRNRIRV